MDEHKRESVVLGVKGGGLDLKSRVGRGQGRGKPRRVANGDD